MRKNLTELMKGLVRVPKFMIPWLKEVQSRISAKWETNPKWVAFCNLLQKIDPQKKELTFDPQALLSISNLLCLIRGIGILPLFLIGGMLNLPQCFYPVVYSVLMATDSIDGPIARSLNLESKLGRTIDPWSDKICHLTMATTAAIFGLLPIWLPAILFIRETIAVTRPKRSEGSKWFGKVGTIAQFVIFNLAFIFPISDLIFIGLALWQIGGVAVYLRAGRKKSNLQ